MTETTQNGNGTKPATDAQRKKICAVLYNAKIQIKAFLTERKLDFKTMSRGEASALITELENGTAMPVSMNSEHRSMDHLDELSRSEPVEIEKPDLDLDGIELLATWMGESLSAAERLAEEHKSINIQNIAITMFIAMTKRDGGLS